VLQLILGQGAKLTLLGVAVGLGAAWGLSRVLGNLLFEIKATDPATFLSISLLLVSIALLACFFPARRALSVDPMIALRAE
jgi:putative ABC transport system permease protein